MTETCISRHHTIGQLRLPDDGKWQYGNSPNNIVQGVLVVGDREIAITIRAHDRSGRSHAIRLMRKQTPILLNLKDTNGRKKHASMQHDQLVLPREMIPDVEGDAPVFVRSWKDGWLAAYPEISHLIDIPFMSGMYIHGWARKGIESISHLTNIKCRSREAAEEAVVTIRMLGRRR